MADDIEALVLRSDKDGLTTLTLNRPAKLNALNPPMFEELRAHVDAIAADASVGCVVLTGAGRAFCAGHDLGSISAGERARDKNFEPETVDAIEALPMPTIAKIRGHCYTGGLELALLCDLRLAAHHAVLGFPETSLGVIPGAGGTQRLPRLLGEARASTLRRQLDSSTVERRRCGPYARRPSGGRSCP